MDGPTTSPDSPDFLAAVTPFSTSPFAHDETSSQWSASLTSSYNVDPMLLADSSMSASLDFGSSFRNLPRESDIYTTPGSSQDTGEGASGADSKSQLRFCKILGCSNKKGFRRESDLVRHQYKHTRPYGCATLNCPMSFASKADMVRHRREVHGFDESTGGPPPDYPCPVVSCKRSKRGFARLWNMQQHVKKMHGEGNFAVSNAADDTADSPASIDSDAGPQTPESVGVGGSPLVRNHSNPGINAQMGQINLETPSCDSDRVEELKIMKLKLGAQERKRDSLVQKRAKFNEEVKNTEDHINTLKRYISNLESRG